MLKPNKDSKLGNSKIAPANPEIGPVQERLTDLEKDEEDGKEEPVWGSVVAGFRVLGV